MSERLAARLQPLGLTIIGGFHPRREDAVDAATILLIGNAGSQMWRQFPSKPVDPAGQTINRWSRDILAPLAAEFGATALFPFEGPPYAPFLSWAFRTGRCFSSPLGMAIHDTYGLWFALRAGFLFADRLPLQPTAATNASPCATCADRPCLSACPVNAFGDPGYDDQSCRNHVRDRPNTCADAGCLARRACPVGRAWRYEPAHAAYHMRAFAPVMAEDAG